MRTSEKFVQVKCAELLFHALERIKGCTGWRRAYMLPVARRRVGAKNLVPCLGAWG